MDTLNVQSVYTIAIYIPIQLIVLDTQIPDSTYAFLAKSMLLFIDLNLSLRMDFRPPIL